ncbi:hypothetical protein Tco_1551181 [Tanacetum coccineum]
MTWRRFILALGLHTAEEMAGDGFKAYWVGRGQTPEKVTATDLFYLRSMDEGMAVNVPYLLAHYLFRHAEEIKRGASWSGCGDTLAWVTPGPEKQQAVAAGPAQVDPDVVEEGA